METNEYKGFNGTLILGDDSLVIKRGFKGFMFGGGKIRGDKTIPYASISAVQFKKAGLTTGYIQFTLVGGIEGGAGVFQAQVDENSVSFYQGQNKAFERAKEFVEARVRSHKGGSKHSDANDLEKYAELRDKGVISEEEFQAKKKQILGV